MRPALPGDLYAAGKDFEFYRRLGKWRAAAAEAFNPFLSDYPLEGFDRYAPAPQTPAKRDLIDINRRSPELFRFAWRSSDIDLPYRHCAT